MEIQRDTVFFFYQSTCYDENNIFMYIEATKQKANGEIEEFERVEGQVCKGLSKADFQDFVDFVSGCNIVTYDEDWTREIVKNINAYVPVSLDGKTQDLLPTVTARFRLANQNQLLAVAEQLGIEKSFRASSPSGLLRRIYNAL